MFEEADHGSGEIGRVTSEVEGRRSDRGGHDRMSECCYANDAFKAMGRVRWVDAWCTKTPHIVGGDAVASSAPQVRVRHRAASDPTRWRPAH